MPAAVIGGQADRTPERHLSPSMVIVARQCISEVYLQMCRLIVARRGERGFDKRGREVTIRQRQMAQQQRGRPLTSESRAGPR